MTGCLQIVLAMKPTDGNFVENVLRHGAGVLNIDVCRIGTGDDRTSGGASGSGAWGNLDSGFERPSGGRWPANFIHDGSEGVLVAFPETKAAYVNADSAAAKLAERKPTTQRGITSFDDRKPCSSLYTDVGLAARFFKQVDEFELEDG